VSTASAFGLRRRLGFAFGFGSASVSEGFASGAAFAFAFAAAVFFGFGLGLSGFDGVSSATSVFFAVSAAAASCSSLVGFLGSSAIGRYSLLDREWERKVRVGANSPSLCPTIDSEM